MMTARWVAGGSVRTQDSERLAANCCGWAVGFSERDTSSGGVGWLVGWLVGWAAGSGQWAVGISGGRQGRMAEWVGDNWGSGRAGQAGKLGFVVTSCDQVSQSDRPAKLPFLVAPFSRRLLFAG